MQATHIYTDRSVSTYIVRMDDGTYRYTTSALTDVHGHVNAQMLKRRLASRTWDGLPTCEEARGAEGRVLLGTLNNAAKRRGTP